MNKTDRLITIACIGIFLISATNLFTGLRKQKIFRENLILTEQETNQSDAVDVKIWRTYHEEQVGILHEILLELKVLREAQCKN